jgi:hypothetical protein
LGASLEEISALLKEIVAPLKVPVDILDALSALLHYIGVLMKG